MRDERFGRYLDRWVTSEFLDMIDPRYVQVGEGLVRFTYGDWWETYEITRYDFTRQMHLLGRLVRTSGD